MDNACCFFTLVFLESSVAFMRVEVVSVLRELAPKFLAEVADALAGLLRHLGDEAGAGWNERIGPWFRNHWPHRKEQRTAEVSRALAEVAIEAGEGFGDAVEVLQSHLVAFEESTVAENRLKEVSHVCRFPAATLTLFNAIVPDAPKLWVWSGLDTLLDDVAVAGGNLSDDPRFRCFQNIAARAGL